MKADGPALLCRTHQDKAHFTHTGLIDGDQQWGLWTCCGHRGGFAICSAFEAAFDAVKTDIPVTAYQRKIQDDIYQRQRAAWGSTNTDEAYDRS